MLVATDFSGAELGTFEQGACADGSDFTCGPRGGVFSCRPCDFTQLEAFKQLQKIANQLVVGLGMEKSPAVITGLNSCEGGDILAIDGRVGPCTKRTIARIIRVFGPLTMAPTNPLLDLENFKPTSEYIASVIPELTTYFRQLVALSKAPKDVPAPAQQPIKGFPAPGKVPLSILPGNGVRELRPPVNGGKVALGIMAALAAIGLVGTGVYYYRSEQG